ncbi:hypothetical protein J8273_5321 [Carpediemonas membranifera]|uniref:TmcB/TmcC TPR repeats domain-containing protein n=1 Tax=Carpediemonas membranifera TaxID=201153 RepID=A0A8J6BWD2_9EUKA|nr:hypothetical protein J8273_5321 [Carpediemonas membranifera]|eukprot:KAG9392331.1 hypothetical protein J8273_5321 [Carpediemonas membranifera]
MTSSISTTMGNHITYPLNMGAFWDSICRFIFAFHHSESQLRRFRLSLFILTHCIISLELLTLIFHISWASRLNADNLIIFSAIGFTAAFTLLWMPLEITAISRFHFLHKWRQTIIVFVIFLGTSVLYLPLVLLFSYVGFCSLVDDTQCSANLSPITGILSIILTAILVAGTAFMRLATFGAPFLRGCTWAFEFPSAKKVVLTTIIDAVLCVIVAIMTLLDEGYEKIITLAILVGVSGTTGLVYVWAPGKMHPVMWILQVTQYVGVAIGSSFRMTSAWILVPTIPISLILSVLLVLARTILYHLKYMKLMELVSVPQSRHPGGILKTTNRTAIQLPKNYQFTSLYHHLYLSRWNKDRTRTDDCRKAVAVLEQAATVDNGTMQGRLALITFLAAVAGDVDLALIEASRTTEMLGKDLITMDPNVMVMLVGFRIGMELDIEETRGPDQDTLTMIRTAERRAQVNIDDAQRAISAFWQTLTADAPDVNDLLDLSKRIYRNARTADQILSEILLKYPDRVPLIRLYARLCSDVLMEPEDANILTGHAEAILELESQPDQTLPPAYTTGKDRRLSRASTGSTGSLPWRGSTIVKTMLRRKRESALLSRSIRTLRTSIKCTLVLLGVMTIIPALFIQAILLRESALYNISRHTSQIAFTASELFKLSQLLLLAESDPALVLSPAGHFIAVTEIYSALEQQYELMQHAVGRLEEALVSPILAQSGLFDEFYGNSVSLVYYNAVDDDATIYRPASFIALARAYLSHAGKITRQQGEDDDFKFLIDNLSFSAAGRIETILKDIKGQTHLLWGSTSVFLASACFVVVGVMVTICLFVLWPAFTHIDRTHLECLNIYLHLPPKLTRKMERLSTRSTPRVISKSRSIRFADDQRPVTNNSAKTTEAAVRFHPGALSAADMTAASMEQTNSSEMADDSMSVERRIETRLESVRRWRRYLALSNLVTIALFVSCVGGIILLSVVQGYAAATNNDIVSAYDSLSVLERTVGYVHSVTHSMHRRAISFITDPAIESVNEFSDLYLELYTNVSIGINEELSSVISETLDAMTYLRRIERYDRIAQRLVLSTDVGIDSSLVCSITAAPYNYTAQADSELETVKYASSRTSGFYSTPEVDATKPDDQLLNISLALLADPAVRSSMAEFDSHIASAVDAASSTVFAEVDELATNRDASMILLWVAVCTVAAAHLLLACSVLLGSYKVTVIQERRHHILTFQTQLVQFIHSDELSGLDSASRSMGTTNGSKYGGDESTVHEPSLAATPSGSESDSNTVPPVLWRAVRPPEGIVQLAQEGMKGGRLVHARWKRYWHRVGFLFYGNSKRRGLLLLVFFLAIGVSLACIAICTVVAAQTQSSDVDELAATRHRLMTVRARLLQDTFDIFDSAHYFVETGSPADGFAYSSAVAVDPLAALEMYGETLMAQYPDRDRDKMIETFMTAETYLAHMVNSTRIATRMAMWVYGIPAGTLPEISSFDWDVATEPDAILHKALYPNLRYEYTNTTHDGSLEAGVQLATARSIIANEMFREHEITFIDLIDLLFEDIDATLESIGDELDSEQHQKMAISGLTATLFIPTWIVIFSTIRRIVRPRDIRQNRIIIQKVRHSTSAESMRLAFKHVLQLVVGWVVVVLFAFFVSLLNKNSYDLFSDAAMTLSNHRYIMGQAYAVVNNPARAKESFTMIKQSVTVVDEFVSDFATSLSVPFYVYSNILSRTDLIDKIDTFESLDSHAVFTKVLQLMMRPSKETSCTNLGDDSLALFSSLKELDWAVDTSFLREHDAFLDSITFRTRFIRAVQLVVTVLLLFWVALSYRTIFGPILIALALQESMTKSLLKMIPRRHINKHSLISRYLSQNDGTLSLT